MLLVEQVQQFIDRQAFPTVEEFIKLLSDGGTQFIQQEDINWDFKDQWPFSYSDEYFLGIARLTSAFANTLGGFIVFGVNDEKRIGGYNKVKVNTDKFRQSVIAYMGRCPDLEVRHYELGALGEIDCLFISPRKMGEPPYRFTKDTKYRQLIWVREGHSVARAEPRHIPLLYCRIDQRAESDNSKWISGSLPPSPRKIDKFIGRLESMNYLFNWLYNSDEPFAYLYGKGGSGKTTIAHEFASIIKRYGADIKIYQNDSIDLVLFLSAKEKSFVAGDASRIITNETDFWDERSLYINVLRYSGLYTASDKLDEKELPELRKLIVEFFDEFSSVIVLDDIDTLTTKNIEVGTNFLNRMLGRAKRVSKLLCTQRNIPSHAISNSAEVPGLASDGEYQEFVSKCASQYGVRVPTKPEDEKMATISERRPLVVEYIIALVRGSPNYDAAFRLFEGDTGNDIRDYVFRREWTSLPNGPDSRDMLAALAILNRPASFADLSSILRFGDGRLKDSISASRAMFLQINDAGNEATYSLDVMTREFVSREANNMDHVSTIKARIKSFEKTYFPEIPRISQIGMRTADLVRKTERTGDQQCLIDAWSIVTDSNLPASVIEHPRFKSIFGFVASKMQPPRLEDARGAFRFVMDTKYEPPIEHLRAWFYAERNSGIGFSYSMAICDFVSKGKHYERQEKVDFAALKASSLFHRGVEKSIDEPADAVALLLEGLKLNLFVYKQNIDLNSYKVSGTEKNVVSAAYTLLNLCLKNLHLHETIANLVDILTVHTGYLDPLEQPIVETLSRVYLKGYDNSVLHRARRELSKLIGLELKAELWMDKTCFARIKTSATSLDKAIAHILP